MTILTIALLTLATVPISIVLGAYLARWIAQFLFSERESEIVAVAAMIGSGFANVRISNSTSGLVLFCGLLEWAIGLAILKKLWRKSEVKHA